MIIQELSPASVLPFSETSTRARFQATTRDTLIASSNEEKKTQIIIYQVYITCKTSTFAFLSICDYVSHLPMCVMSFTVDHAYTFPLEEAKGN